MNRFPDSFHFLSQEGHLISACLTTGLTNLRAANVFEKGNFYAALFNLSIGMERLLKAIIIIEHMAKNDLECPSKKQMKQYGHNVQELYDTCHDVSLSYSESIPKRKDLENIQQDMLNSLSEFAMNSRYYNLDSLSSGKRGLDPIEQWGEIYIRVWHSEVTDRMKEKVLAEAGMKADWVDKNVQIVMHGMSKEPLSSFDVLALPNIHEHAAKHVLLKIINILYPLRRLSSDVSGHSYSFEEFVFPQMQEFLKWLWNDRKHVLSKKVWP